MALKLRLCLRRAPEENQPRTFSAQLDCWSLLCLCQKGRIVVRKFRLPERCDILRPTIIKHNRKPGAFSIFMLIFTKLCKLRISVLVVVVFLYMFLDEKTEVGRVPLACLSSTVAHQHSRQSSRKMQPSWIFL